MTPTAEWYEADADDSDRSTTNDVTANAHETAHAANLPASDAPRGYSDAHLLRKRTAALDRVAAENERLRAEVERLREDKVTYTKWTDRWIADMELMETRVARAEDEAEVAEAKLRDVEALADQWETPYGSPGLEWNTSVGATYARHLRAVLARSQAPQAPAIPEAVWHAWHGDAPSPCPATADDEGVRRG